jgi:hypothetical protein
MGVVRSVPGHTNANPWTGIIGPIRVPEVGDTSQVEKES